MFPLITIYPKRQFYSLKWNILAFFCHFVQIFQLSIERAILATYTTYTTYTSNIQYLNLNKYVGSVGRCRKCRSV